MTEAKAIIKHINAQIKEHKEEKREHVRFSTPWHHANGAIEALNRLKITITSA
jgi:hypothetical protein